MYMRFMMTLFFSFSLMAQAGAEPYELAPEESHQWQNEAWENFKSPITTPAINIVWVGSGLTLTLVALRDEIVEPFQEHTTKIKPLDEWAPVGDYAGQLIPNIFYFGGMLADYYATGSVASREHASSMMQATLYAVSVTGLLKATVRQPRPNDPETLTSFPSGHTTSAFAFSSYVACNHASAWGVASYALATLVGYSRINDNAHYLHDVVAGATIGTAYGLGLCYQNRRRQAQEPGPEQVTGTQMSFGLAPSRDGLAGALFLSF